MTEKPTDCTCDQRASNRSGHAPSCPAYKRWHMRLGVVAQVPPEVDLEAVLPAKGGDDGPRL
jgi:hypothetical protein